MSEEMNRILGQEATMDFIDTQGEDTGITERVLEEAYLADREVIQPMEMETQMEAEGEAKHFKESKAPRKKIKKTIMGNRLVQFIAHVLFVCVTLIAVGLACLCVYFYANNMYTMNFSDFYQRMAYQMAYEQKEEILDYTSAGASEGLEHDLVNTNVSYYYYKDDIVIYSYLENMSDNQYVYEFPVYYSGWSNNPEEWIKVVINGEFPAKDIFWTIYRFSGDIYHYRYAVPMATAVSILLVLGIFYFLMCSAGYKNGKEGITASVLSPVHLEIVTLVYGVVLSIGIIAVHELATRRFLGNLVLVTSFLILALLWTVAFCREVAVRVKQGVLIKNTLIYCILHFLWKILKKLGKVMGNILSWVPLVHKTILIFLFICFLELMGLLIWGDEELVVLWVLEKLILLPVCIYVASLCKKLLHGTEALAEGKLTYKVDTEKMFGDFKEHGENLNQISLGIARAVDERTKSERMKTELITNVSHDIKTPLTSIINYAGLISSEPTDNEKIQEYSEVLLRQSKRLKKLLDDLLEASKATTGTLECHFVPCEIGVLLTQAAGEYEQLFADKKLELIMDRPEEDVTIIADGKHMWRVFDNLLNNICKYSQEHSRVYISLQKTSQEAQIIFRNMSKFALNVSGEELEERFVRGDKSRNMEGNGLGLSIARSLVELQHGQMQVVTDGDLFKVILKFELMEEN